MSGDRGRGGRRDIGVDLLLDLGGVGGAKRIVCSSCWAAVRSARRRSIALAMLLPWRSFRLDGHWSQHGGRRQRRQPSGDLGANLGGAVVLSDRTAAAAPSARSRRRGGLFTGQLAVAGAGWIDGGELLTQQHQPLVGFAAPFGGGAVERASVGGGLFQRRQLVSAVPAGRSCCFLPGLPGGSEIRNILVVCRLALVDDVLTRRRLDRRGI